MIIARTITSSLDVYLFLRILGVAFAARIDIVSIPNDTETETNKNYGRLDIFHGYNA